MLNAETYYKDNVKLVHKFARKVFARAKTIGAPMEYEDVFQEASLVFLKCFQSFDPNAGFAFSSYFSRAFYFEVNKILADYETEIIKSGTRSIEEYEGDSEQAWLLEVIPSNEPTPEELLELSETSRILVEKVSGNLALVIELLVNPHQWMVDELLHLRRHVEYARSQGIEKRAKPEITIDHVCRCLTMIGMFDCSDVSNVKREVRKLGALVA